MSIQFYVLSLALLKTLNMSNDYIILSYDYITICWSFPHYQIFIHIISNYPNISVIFKFFRYGNFLPRESSE